MLLVFLEVGNTILVIVDAEMNPEMITEDEDSLEVYQRELKTSYKAISLLLLSVLKNYGKVIYSYDE